MIIIPRLLVAVLAMDLMLSSWSNGQRWWANLRGESVIVRVVNNEALSASVKGGSARIFVAFQGQERTLLVDKRDRDRYANGVDVQAKWLHSRDLLVAIDKDHAADSLVTSMACVFMVFVWFRLPRWMTAAANRAVSGKH